MLFSVSFGCHAKEEMTTLSSFGEPTVTDSVRNPSHFYYLADLPIKKTGELILKDSIKPSDNYITFSLMNAISVCKKSDLDFFLKVFEKILNDADGALAEAVGSYTWNFIEKRPFDFINHIDTLNDKQIIKRDYIIGHLLE